MQLQLEAIHIRTFWSDRSSALPPANLKYFLGPSAQKSEFAGLINYETYGKSQYRIS